MYFGMVFINSTDYNLTLGYVRKPQKMIYEIRLNYYLMTELWNII